MSLDVAQFRAEVVRPTLRILGPEFGGEWAEHLLLGTAAVESGFRALRQYGGGPAVGLFQMEPATYTDCFVNYLDFRDELRFLVLSLSSRYSGERPPSDEMAWNLRFACAMARIKYRRARDPLPAARDVAAMERYHKANYNSSLGKTQPGDFTRAWQRHVAPIL